jgi:ABC-type Fe3+ transport system substrate-binding protein
MEEGVTMEVLLHIPMNLRGYLMGEMESFLYQQEDAEIERPKISQPAHNHSISWLEQRINNQSLPDMAMAHVSDFAHVKDLAADQYFQPSRASLADLVRPEFKKFFQPESMFTLVYFMPAVVIVNDEVNAEKLVEVSWKNVAQGGSPIVMPDRDTPITKTVLGFLKKHDHSLYESFVEKIVFVNSPLDVIEKVVSGEFPVGVANQSFSLMSQSRGINILPTTEGPIPLPQVMVQKRPGTERDNQVIGMMLESSIQQYLLQQGAWPVTLTEEIYGFRADNQWIQGWNGWETLLDSIRMVEEDLHKEDRSC